MAESYDFLPPCPPTKQACGLRFGGDPEKVTALSQSAGGESLSLHNLSHREEPLYRRSITLSGTLVTMPATSPQQYQELFLSCAKNMGIETSKRSSTEIAEGIIFEDVEKIRAANFVGAPCASSKILPYEWPIMRLTQSGRMTQVDWLQSHIVSSCTYDGSISYTMTRKNPERMDYARTFIALARKLLREPRELLHTSSMNEDDGDDEALQKICLFESDIGFLSAALCQARGSIKTKTYIQVFDLGNSLEGLLPKKEYASHTWDIVALLGAYEDRLNDQYRAMIGEWRSMVLELVADGRTRVAQFSEGNRALLVDKERVREVADEELPGAGRRARLWRLAKAEQGEDGLDFLWEDVCRRWLDVSE